MRNTTSYEIPDANSVKQFITLDSFIEENVFYFALQLYNPENIYFAEWRFTYEDLQKFITARMRYVEYQKQILNQEISAGLKQVEEGKVIPGEEVFQKLNQNILEGQQAKIERLKRYLLDGAPTPEEPGYKQYLLDVDQLTLGGFSL